MKMKKTMPKGGIVDINIGYNTEVERYTTVSQSINELDAMASWVEKKNQGE